MSNFKLLTNMFLLMFILLLTVLDKNAYVFGETKKSLVVVEYHPITDPSFTKKEMQVKNAEEYIKIIKKVSQKNDDVSVLFPEETLDNIENSDDLSIYAAKMKEDVLLPCNTSEYPKTLQMLSCAARKYQVNIFFNVLIETEYTVYTGDVVINSSGTLNDWITRENRIGTDALKRDPISFVIPVYHNVMFSSQNGLPDLSLSVVSFTTGFRFSYEKILIPNDDNRFYMICSNWISQLPFLTSLQVMQMWAQEFNITIFLSGANNPKKGQGGTAIYDVKQGPILMEFGTKGVTKMYVYNFEITNRHSGKLTEDIPEKSVDDLAIEMDNFYLEKDPDLYRYKSILLDKNLSDSDVKLCYNNKTESNYFCCHFNFKLSVDSSVSKKTQYVYHMVVYKGYKTYYDIFEPGGVEVCAIIACLNSSIDSCGERFKNYNNVQWPITFEKLVIKATFGLHKKEKIYYSSQFPNSLLSSIRPIHPSSTSWTSEIVYDANKTARLERTFALTKPHSKILTFGIFARNFTLIDPKSKCEKTNLLYALDTILCLVVIIFT